MYVCVYVNVYIVHSSKKVYKECLYEIIKKNAFQTIDVFIDSSISWKCCKFNLFYLFAMEYSSSSQDNN